MRAWVWLRARAVGRLGKGAAARACGGGDGTGIAREDGGVAQGAVAVAGAVACCAGYTRDM